MTAPDRSREAVDVLWDGTRRAVVLALCAAGFAVGVAVLTRRDAGPDAATVFGGLGLMLEAGWAARRLALLGRAAWRHPGGALAVALAAALPVTTTLLWYIERLHVDGLRFGWAGILRGGAGLAALAAAPVALLLVRHARSRTPS